MAEKAETDGAANDRKSRQAARHMARVAAVQALYQMDLAHTDVGDVIAQFLAHRFDRIGEEGALATPADKEFFAEVLRGVVRRQLEIDPMIDDQLAEGWRLFRIDSILRAILRSGVYELLERPDVPVRAVISQYVDVAHAFFAEDEPKVVNGVLDKLARHLRPAEFT